jgi:purine catabolism regulator
MLTVSGLAKDCGLELAAGAVGADRSIRWVHISELEDPTPFMSGGELLLTTGIQLATAARQRRFVGLLDDRGLAGLGFGTGFEHRGLPKALVDEAERRGLPLFEVPYEMPFIAITERAFTALVNEQYDVMARGTKVHERLERLVIEGRGLDEVVASTAAAIGGAAVVQEPAGRELARHPGRGSRRGKVISGPGLRALRNEVARRADGGPVEPFAPGHASLEGRAITVPVPGRRGGQPVAWLTVVSERDALGDFERLIARQAAIVVGLELMRERVVRETERRLAGDLLAEALTGRLDSDDLRGRLRPFGIGSEGAVLVFELEDPHEAEPTLRQTLADSGVAALVATTATGGTPYLCAVVAASGDEPMALAGKGRLALSRAHGPTRAAASRPVSIGSLRRAFHEARCALDSLADGDAPEVASHRDLGSFTLLLSLQDDEALRTYSDGLLEPIEGAEGEYGGELLRSLEAYIEHNGNWERAARELFCHRHTLRYRIRKVEELTGRDLGRATDRIELWLALRARELVR